jgi:hypothetical protein
VTQIDKPLLLVAMSVLSISCSSTPTALDMLDGDAGPDASSPDATSPDATSPVALRTCEMGSDLILSVRFAATVEASGALTFHHSSATEASPPAEATGTLTSVDATGSSFELTTASGTIDVVVHPVPQAWLEALPVGASVVAQFEDGVTLTDADDGALLLAVLATHTRPVVALDAGPFHIVVGDATCITAGWPLADGPTGCAQGVTQTDATVTADGRTVALQTGAPTLAMIDGRPLTIELVRSARPATDDEVFAALPDARGRCANLLDSELAVVIGPG